MEYPGRIIEVGERDAVIVRAIKQQLNGALGVADDSPLYLNPSNGSFGPKMKRAVSLFQARNVDDTGSPLKQDGEVGSLTWAALFGSHTVPTRTEAASPLLVAALRIAARQESDHVREVPRNSNRGPKVDEYLECAACPPGNSWCCAFVYWCMNEAAKELGRRNPMVKTAGCLDHWQRATAKGATRFTTARALGDLGLMHPGLIFIMDHGGGFGHTGFVEKVDGGLLTTLEGNTDASKTREGGGVYRLTRKIADVNKGFIDYSAV
ncbi:MAG TPA: CHAP domain-containing protein [Gemmatimonadaceae bacterium]